MRIGIVLPAVFSAVLVSPVLAQDAAITFKSTELAEGLYMIEGQGGFAGGNLGLLIGEDGVVLIDDGLPPLIDQVQAAIDQLTEAPVDFLINTHVHGDHIGGNAVLSEEATIVAHDNLRKRLEAEGMPTGPGTRAPAPEEALPVVTFSDSVTFHLNGREAFVFHVANAHTDGDAIIHFREDNVMHAGDVMFNGMFPFIDLDSGGSVDGFIAGQERMLAMADDETRLIPGHGPIAAKKDLQASVDMLKEARDRVQALLAAGKSEEEIVEANPLASYDEWSWEFITTERMTRALVRGLSEE